MVTQRVSRLETQSTFHLKTAPLMLSLMWNRRTHTLILRAFLTEVRRVLTKGGLFLYTYLPVPNRPKFTCCLSLWYVQESERDITANVLKSCDQVATNRAKAFGGSSEMIDNFLAVPGSVVYEQMNSGAWEYRIIRARKA